MLLGTVLAVLDSSILNLSVVPIMDEFRADLSTVRWALTSYNLTFAAFMIGFGSLGDATGRRRLYLFGQVTFVVGSGLVAIATGPGQLIAFRAIQGIGAAALAPNALALIHESFPERERGVALGIWGTAAGLGGALGSTVGGIVAQGWGWRWLFLLNLPLGVLVAAAAWGLLARDPGRRREGRVEVRAFFALSAALLAFSLAVLGAPGAPSGWARGGFGALALLFGTWFVRVERRAAVPLVDPGAILRPRVLTASLALFVALLIMDGGMFLSVLYAQLLGGISPAAIGLLLVPCATAAFALAPAGGWLAYRVGPRPLAVAGLVGLAASVAVPIEWHPASAASLVFWSNLIAGASIGLGTPALVLIATNSVPRQRVGLGAGVYKTVNELGGVFGVVLLGTFLETQIIANALRQIPGHFLPQELSLRTVASLEVLENHAVQKGLAPENLEGFHRALTEAVQRGFDEVFGLAAVVASLGVLAGLMLPRRLTQEPIETGDP
jgi:EmrB/QacA subfamily drug resistance transporter